MAKVKRHSQLLIPNIIVVGKREMEGGTASLRRDGKQSVMPRQELIDWLAREARVR